MWINTFNCKGFITAKTYTREILMHRDHLYIKCYDHVFKAICFNGAFLAVKNTPKFLSHNFILQMLSILCRQKLSVKVIFDIY